MCVLLVNLLGCAHPLFLYSLQKTTPNPLKIQENAILYSLLFPPSHLPKPPSHCPQVSTDSWPTPPSWPMWKREDWDWGGWGVRQEKSFGCSNTKSWAGKEGREPDRGSVCGGGISLRHLRHRGGARYYYPSLPSALSRWVLAPVTKPPFKTLTATFFFYPSFSFFLSPFFQRKRAQPNRSLWRPPVVKKSIVNERYLSV